MNSLTMMDRRVENVCRKFVVDRFHDIPPHQTQVRQTIKDLARIVIGASVSAGLDVIAAARGMIDGIRISAQNTNLNVQSAVCEAATAAYDVAAELNGEMAHSLKRMVEGPQSDYHISIYKRYKGRDADPVSAWRAKKNIDNSSRTGYTKHLSHFRQTNLVQDTPCLTKSFLSKMTKRSPKNSAIASTNTMSSWPKPAAKPSPFSKNHT